MEISQRSVEKTSSPAQNHLIYHPAIYWKWEKQLISAYVVEYLLSKLKAWAETGYILRTFRPDLRRPD